jgi:hypothetical protein
VITAVAHRSRPLMSVPARDPIKAELVSALADLHTLAGWCCVDSGLQDQARACFATAMDLAAAPAMTYRWRPRSGTLAFTCGTQVPTTMTLGHASSV